MEKQSIETTGDDSSGHDPDSDREAQGQHHPDLPGEGGSEHCGEEPHDKPSVALPRPMWRELKAMERGPPVLRNRPTYDRTKHDHPRALAACSHSCCVKSPCNTDIAGVAESAFAPNMGFGVLMTPKLGTNMF